MEFGIRLRPQTHGRLLFGSVNAAIGHYYKMGDGTRIQVVGVAEDGKLGLSLVPIKGLVDYVTIDQIAHFSSTFTP